MDWFAPKLEEGAISNFSIIIKKKKRGEETFSTSAYEILCRRQCLTSQTDTRHGEELINIDRTIVKNLVAHLEVIYSLERRKRWKGLTNER
jgi:hypothetical protein